MKLHAQKSAGAPNLCTLTDPEQLAEQERYAAKDEKCDDKYQGPHAKARLCGDDCVPVIEVDYLVLQLIDKMCRDYQASDYPEDQKPPAPTVIGTEPDFLFQVQITYFKSVSFELKWVEKTIWLSAFMAETKLLKSIQVTTAHWLC